MKPAVLDALSTTIAVLDRDGVIVAVNEPWRRFALENSAEPGKPARNTEIGTNYLEVVRSVAVDHSADGAREASEGIPAVLDGTLASFNLEYPCHSPQRQRWFSMSVTPLYGGEQGVVVEHTDITDRKRAEEKLLESEERYRTLIEGSPEAIAVHREGRLLYVNPAAVTMFGASSEHELLGQSILDRVHPDYRRIALQRMTSTSAQAGGLPARSEKFLKLDGTAIDVEVQGTAILYSGQPAIRESMRDVTERTQTQNELAALRAEMKEMLELQVATHTVAALAHEVNQPLSSISALSEAARRILSADTTAAAAPGGERLENILQRIAVESERAGDVLRNLMKSLRTPDTTLETLAPAPLVAEMVRVARAGGFEDCEFLVDCAADLPAVRVNRLQVEKVLLNLIGNSAEAMRHASGQGRRIWISVGVDDSGKAACVTVRDEGPGIAKELETQMFHPFVTSKASGIGMGLTICRTLAEALGGKLWYEAHDGPGATFRFTLPFAGQTQ